MIPTRWNLRGDVDGYGPRERIFLIGPGVMLLQMALFALLPHIAPRRFEIAPFMETWLDLMVIMVGMTGYFFAMIVVGVLQTDFAIDRALFGGVALLFALTGNLMGKIRRNFFFGIRTPWALASERVWNATHRVAARSMVAGGLVGLVIALLGASLWWMSLVLACALALPVVYSFFRYRSETVTES